MSDKSLVAVAMSGGVDSSVAALLLRQQGYRIVGLTMQLVPCGGEKVGGCCGIEAVRSAQKVCKKLGVPHYVVNFCEPFKQTVIKNFIQEYGRGHTPNPCVACNEKIKFDLLLKKALDIGADYLATGHYAIKKSKKQKAKSKIIYELQKGKDKNKDQSYFLYRLTQSQLKYLLFPLGNLTKPQVRRLAAKAGLPTATKPESQEICFIPDNNYRKFLAGAVSVKNEPGLIVDKKGKILGRHSGLSQYTIGQRKRLGCLKIKNQKSKITSQKSKTAENQIRPHYVIKIDVKNNKLIVGAEKDLYQKKCLAKNVNWINGQVPKLPFSVVAKIRYRSPVAKVTLKKQGQNLLCRFVKPQRAITPGQSIVFYLPRGRKATLRGQGSQVLGGGIIELAID